MAQTFKKNVGQQRVLDLIKSPAKEILVASGSRCFAAGTLVKTRSGHKPIESIKEGEFVLSTDILTNELQYKKVLKTFHNDTEQSKQMVIFVLRNGSQINCTIEHDFYKEGTFTPAIDIAKRTMESGTWNKRNLSGEQFGQDKNIQLEGYEKRSSDEASKGCERIFADDDKENRRQVPYHKDASDCCAGMATQPRKQARSKSHKQRSIGQSNRKSGMGYTTRKSKTHDGSRSSDVQQWIEERDGYNDRGTGFEDTQRVRQIERMDGKAMVASLRSEILCVTRSPIRKNLEAREIDYDEIIGVYFYNAKIKTFDLCVADNFNYTITKDNIQVSNSGKTFIILYAIIFIAAKFPKSRHLVARKFFNHVKGSIWLDTLPTVLEKCFPELLPHVRYNNTDFYLTLPNGSEIWMGGLDDKERVDKILGREYLTIFFNECSEITYDTYVTVKSRLAQKCSYVNEKGELVWGKNMCLLDENPTTAKHWSKIVFIDKKDPKSELSPKADIRNPERYAFTFIHPHENQENISSDYLEMLESMPKEQRKRFLEGVFAESSEYALWDDEVLEKYRVNEAPALKRIVVAIDPAVTANKESDETGIIVAGIGFDNHLYPLEDLTGKYDVTEWPRIAIDAFDKWKADCIVAEVNQGGDLVELNIRMVRPNIPYKGVHATRSKFTRAEPVAALYYLGKAHHVGVFTNLEFQMTQWEGKKGEKSPNNIDALVWAASDLFPEIGVNKRMGGTFAQAMRGL